MGGWPGYCCITQQNHTDPDVPSVTHLAGVLADAINRCDPQLLRSICASTYQGYDASREAAQHGRLAFMDDLRRLTDSFSDGRVSIVSQTAEGNRSAVFWMFRGTHTGSFLGIPATLRVVRICGVSHLESDGEHLIRGLHLWDMAGLLRGLRLLPDLPDRDSSESLQKGMRRALRNQHSGQRPQPTP